MNYTEVRDYIRGYAEYLTFMNGKEIRCTWNKQYQQYEYYGFESLNEKHRQPKKLVTFEMADINNRLFCNFNYMNGYMSVVLDRYPDRTIGGNLSRGVWRRDFTDIGELKMILDILNEVGFFERY